LPLLKGEVNVVDQMLIEGIRVLYPNLYSAIRDNPDAFLESNREQRMRGVEVEPSRLDQLLEVSLPELTAQERETLRDRLLAPLFPRTTNMGYGAEWNDIWGRDKKICVPRYFRRYFSYGVPDGEVSEAELNEFLQRLAGGEAPDQRQLLEAFAERRAVPDLVTALRRRSETFAPALSVGILRALASNADLVPRERGAMTFGGTQAQTAILIAQLLRRISDMELRQAEAENLARTASPLTFATECMHWVRHSEDRPEELRVLTNEGQGRFDTLIVDRIVQDNEQRPLFLQFLGDASSMYWFWRHERGRQAVETALQARFETHPEEVDAFLECFVSEGWEIQSGLPVRSFERRQYDNVEGLIDAEYVLGNLRQRFGSELDDPIQFPDTHWPLPRKVANQFAYIRRAVQAQRASVESDPANGRDVISPQ
jgi:hypothetical protein